MKRQQVQVDNKLYEVIATIHDDDTNKDFIIFIDKDVDKNKGLTISCALYHEENGEFITEKITEEQDKETARELMKSAIKKIYSIAKKK